MRRFQILGGNGYRPVTTPFERMPQDAEIFTIFEAPVKSSD